MESLSFAETEIMPNGIPRYVRAEVISEELANLLGRVHKKRQETSLVVIEEMDGSD